MAEQNIMESGMDAKAIKEERKRLKDDIKVVELPNYTNKYQSNSQKTNKNLEKFW